MTYSQKLKHPKWQKKRLEILQRDNFKCRLCDDDNSTLHIHHLKYIGFKSDPWDIDNDFLITYCEDCHKLVEECKKLIRPCEIKKVIIEYNNDKLEILRYIYVIDIESNKGGLVVTKLNWSDNNEYEVIFGADSDMLKKHLDILKSYENRQD